MVKWEYKTVSCYQISDYQTGTSKGFGFSIGDYEYLLDEGLNILGEQGFELVSVHNETYRMNDGEVKTSDDFLYIFKRPKE